MIVLDTHALIWWLSDPKRVPIKARRLVDAAIHSKDPAVVSAISVWETAILVQRGRLILTMDTTAWIGYVESLPFFRFVPIDNAIAARSVALPDFPNRDPADRMIVATALGLGATLITADKQIRDYPPVKTAWD